MTTTPAAASQARSQRDRAAGYFALLFATSCWGFGFVSTKALLLGMGPIWATACRLLGATLLMALPIAVVPVWRRSLSLGQLRLALWPGFFVASMLVLQTIGLATTSVANSGFITTLYIVFVPLMMAAITHKPLSLLHGAWVLLALLGTALMCQLHYLVINAGDLFTLLAAVAAAAHIVYVDRVGGRVVNAFTFNILQSAVGGIAASVCALALEPWRFQPPDSGVWFGHFLFLAAVCTVVAYTYQIKAQQVVPANEASVLFLLESPIAAACAWLVLGESLALGQGIGAVLILLAALGVSRREGRPA